MSSPRFPSPHPPSSGAYSIASSSSATATAAAIGPDEEELRRLLRQRLHRITKREPLEPTYKHLLLHGIAAPPTIVKDKNYKKFGADLREKVESYLKAGGDHVGRARGKQREDLEDAPMRAAFTLRESKKHEQEGLIAASLAAAMAMRRVPGGPDEATRKRSLEEISLGLTEKERKRKEQAQRAKLVASLRSEIFSVKKQKAVKEAAEKAAAAGSALSSDGSKSNRADVERRLAEQIKNKEREILLKEEEETIRREREIEERERQRSIERARERERQREAQMAKEEEKARLRAEKEREEKARRERMAETPQQALHRLYEPIFRVLWDMEFANLHGTNPFRIVIDKSNCAGMGVPDYCDVIKKPMNLTYIQEKVDGRKYVTIQEFFAEVELMISNALLYNSDPNNEFHIAAKDMKKKYKRMAKKVIQSLQQQQQQQQQQG